MDDKNFLNEEYKYGFKDEDISVFKTQKGLSEEVIREISKIKNEPEWMLEFRLKAYEKFLDLDNPSWGPDLSEIDFIEYVKQKEILFIKEDMSKIKNEKTDYTRLIKYYKRRLVDYGVMKEIRDYKTQNGKYKRDKVSSRINETISA